MNRLNHHALLPTAGMLLALCLLGLVLDYGLLRAALWVCRYFSLASLF